MTERLPTVPEGKSQSSLGIYFVTMGSVFASAAASLLLQEFGPIWLLVVFFVGLAAVIYGAMRDDLLVKVQRQRALNREIKTLKKELKELKELQAAIDEDPAPKGGAQE